jgi:hypothetical protein
MSRNSFTILTLTVLLLFGCYNSELKQTNGSDLVIKAGFVCGWGSGADSIVISGKGINYCYYIPAKSSRPQISRTRSVSRDEWIQIEDAVNMAGFTRLQYQSCNVCVDGCDEWIFIQKGDSLHKITFGKGRKIDSISSLQAKLAQIRAEFSLN